MKKYISWVLALCMVLSLVAFVPSWDIKADAAAYNINGGTQTSATFIIDPGHMGASGGDPGACALGRQEADDVLAMSLKVGRIIINSGASVSFTRVTSMAQSLSAKCAQANNGSFSYFVSVHRNAGGGTGMETYYYTGSTASYNLAEAINSRVVNATGWRNRGLKSGNHLAVVNGTNMPACLLELGFIDTAADNTIFVNYNDAIANAIADGMLSMVGMSATPSKRYQSTLDAPSLGGASNAAISGTLSYTQNGSSDTVGFSGWTLHSDGISAVRYNIDGGAWTNFSTWLRTDVQAAIGGYNSYENCGFSGTLNYGKIGGGTHTMTIQGVTAAGGTYTVATITLKITDPISPTISNVGVSNVTTTGYRVSCNVGDNCAVTRVAFPTWTSGGGQDDLIWHEGTISGGTAYYDVKISEHGNSNDSYITHIYVYDAAGNCVTGGVGVNLTKDTTAPSITDYSITNVTEFGFDVQCKISDDIGVTKIQFPTWTAANDQDDILWYEPTVSGGVATLHVDTKDHGYQTGTYNVHLYAWDLWNNTNPVKLSVNVPTPAYPADSDYIPLEKANGSQTEASSQILTSGSFTAEAWGVLVLSNTSEGWTVAAKYDAGSAKSLTASASNPIVAVHSGHSAYKAYESVSVGTVVELSGVNLSAGVVIANAHVKLPYSFTLVDESGYSLDETYVKPNGMLKTVAEVRSQFKCEVSVYTFTGAALSDTELCGTGCVVKRLDSNGDVTDFATVVVNGDVNGDGQIGSADYILIVSSASGATAELAGAYHEAADLNGDGQFTGADCIYLQMICRGAI